MKAGDKWDRLECLSVENVDVPVMVVDEFGKNQPYHGGEYTRLNVYRLRCECGKTFDADIAAFKGKRKTKDCGCGLGVDDGQKVGLSVTFPYLLKRRIAVYADEQNVSFSHALVKLAGDAMDRLDSEGEWDTKSDGGKGHGTRKF